MLLQIQMQVQMQIRIHIQIRMLSNYGSNASSFCKWDARWRRLFRAVVVAPWVQMVLPSHLSTLSLGTSTVLCPLKRQDRFCGASRRWIHTRRPMGERTIWQSMGGTVVLLSPRKERPTWRMSPPSCLRG